MTVYTGRIGLKTKSDGGMTDVSGDVQAVVAASRIRDGIAVVFCPGSTGALSTVEYEPGLLKDIPEAMDRIAPRDGVYAHHATWHDDNGSGHVKATIIGPDLTVPVDEGRLLLGRWQQIVFIEFDTKDRERQLTVKVIGE